MTPNLALAGWYPDNHARLSHWLEHRAGEAVAVFDWDNTCIFGDVGDVTLRRQLVELELSPDAALVPEQLGRVQRLRGISLVDLRADVLLAHAALTSGAAPRGGDAHHDLIAKLLWFYDAMLEDPATGPRA